MEKPIKTKQRYYYEEWVGRKVISNTIISNPNIEGYCYQNTLINCYQTNRMNGGNIGYFFAPHKTSHPQIIPHILRNPFNLINVVYHKSNDIENGKDVTQMVDLEIKAQLVHKKVKTILNLPVSNSIFGDPFPNILKQLTIKYRINNDICVKTINENSIHYFNTND